MEMITNQMQTAINEKTRLISELNEKLGAILDLELDLKTKERNMLNKTNWNELLKTDKRVTDKQKNAHIEDVLQKDKNKLANLKGDVEIIKNNIKLCDDKISLAKYMVREMELIKGA